MRLIEGQQQELLVEAARQDLLLTSYSFAYFLSSYNSNGKPSGSWKKVKLAPV